jgi:hypothetical protein
VDDVDLALFLEGDIGGALLGGGGRLQAVDQRQRVEARCRR